MAVSSFFYYHMSSTPATNSSVAPDNNSNSSAIIGTHPFVANNFHETFRNPCPSPITISGLSPSTLHPFDQQSSSIPCPLR